MAPPKDIDTAAGFLEERSDFLNVHVEPSISGEGWDVVLRVDGTYADRPGAEAAAEGMRDWINRLVDVPWRPRPWWNGPPFATEPRPRLVE